MPGPACPICRFTATWGPPANSLTAIACPRCGSYQIDEAARLYAQHSLSEKWPIVSHVLRRANSNAIVVTEAWLQSVCASEKLPTAREQADNLILYLGRAAAPGEYKSESIPALQALIGTTDSNDGRQRGFSFIREHLESDKKLIKPLTNPPSDGQWHARLTHAGWEAFERLQSQVANNRRAFMAMAFNETSVETAFSECFRPAAQAAGFELRKLSDNPRDGNLDVRMEADIRTARFLVCDLTHDNRGAYWEAGFAHGLGRPVFYTCERAKFERDGTHFDTNHHHTILWSSSDLRPALEELKATIRNSLPADAVLTD